MSSGSISFDRAAGYYDATRRTDPVGLERTLDMLQGRLSGDGPVLEIGVGTGALAVPLAARGVRVVGVDLSRPMLEQLQAKASEGLAIPIAVSDATRLPFADHAFAGAYARWVLHLIPDWGSAVGELCRVVSPGGAVAVEPGGYTGIWREVWLRFVQEVGPAAAPVGLDVRTSFDELDRVFAERGAGSAEAEEIEYDVSGSLSRFFDEVSARMYSWTWRVPEDVLERAIAVVRPWALERFGDAQADRGAMVTRWRVYTVGD